ncbi:MAG: rhomboid family intramembrane serine protease [Tenericutes bacterium]|nr:rhomboid family intramembrane serine protease [Mycoplasmatota bacterium]
MDFIKKLQIYYRLHPVTSLILLINFMMVIVLLLTDGFTVENLIYYGALVPSMVTEDGDYYRIFTAMILHGSILHFLMNSFVLYYLGGHMERLIGPIKYFIVYLLSGIVSSLFVVFFGPNAATIGASGAIFGVMGGLLTLTFIRKQWLNPQAIRSIRQLMLINLVITFVIPGISRAGHIGGLVVGLILFFFITPEYPYYYVQQVKMMNENKKDDNDFIE